jgi:hypothetical protein
MVMSELKSSTHVCYLMHSHWCAWFSAEKVGLAGAVTVASSLEYGMSDSSLKLLVPFVSSCNTFGKIYSLNVLYV